jgi:hypothetical protein
MVVMPETVDREALVVPVVPRLVMAQTAETVVLPALRARPVLAEALLPMAILVGKAMAATVVMVAMDSPVAAAELAVMVVRQPLAMAVLAATAVMAARVQMELPASQISITMEVLVALAAMVVPAVPAAV